MYRQRSERIGYDAVIYNQHLERLNNIKTTLDLNPPKKHPLKNKIILEKIKTNKKIDIENKMLLERIAKKIQTSTLDNKLHPSTKMHSKFKKYLSYTKNKIYLEKITNENNELLKKIQKVPPVYNHIKWREQEEKRKIILKNMSLYPEYYKKK